MQVLELETLYTRLVKERRGGWCCELNGRLCTEIHSPVGYFTALYPWCVGLFAWLLGELGFTVTMVSASFFE